jgi:carboxyl-terminal processing protease
MFFSSREKFLTTLSIVLFILLVFSYLDKLSYFSPHIAHAKQNSDKDLYGQLKIFTDILAIVQKEYVKEVNGSELVEGAIKGLISNLDPHSSYLDPEYYEDLQVQTKGEFGGLGIEVSVKEGNLTVVSPMEGGPAEKAGVLPGDIILKINGKLTKDFTMVDAVKNLRGPKGSSVVVTFFRKSTNQTFESELIREIIHVKSVKSRILKDGYGYIKISQFVESTGDDLYMAIRKIEKESPSSKISGLILDLRNNPGGLLNQAVRVADLFIEEGVIVYTDGRIEAQKQKFFATRRGTESSYPLVVLVNNGSASASEIVSGALKEDGRAVIVGNRTFGKGSVQTVSRLENGGGLSLTTALYYLKNGESIQLKGVTPDIEVAQPAVEVKNPSTHLKTENFREESLPGAIINPSEGLDSVDTTRQEKIKDQKDTTDISLVSPNYIDVEKESVENWLQKDKQFSKAYEVLMGY